MSDDRYRCAHCHRFIEYANVVGWVHINCWVDGHDAEPRVSAQAEPLGKPLHEREPR